MSQKLCACGCGLPVRWAKGTYRRGHNNAKQKPWQPKVSQPCACGCGQMTKPGNKVILGHNTPAMRQASSERMRQNNPMHDPDVAARSAASQPATNPKLSQTLRSQYESGEREPTKAGPAARKRFSIRMRQNNPMHDPEVVARMQQTRQANGINQAVGERLKALWADPDFRAAQVERMQQQNPMFDPAIKERSLSKTRQHLEPSKLEQWFGRFCRRYNFPVWYTGTGEFWVQGRNPDFKIHGRKLLIEVTDGYSRQPQRRTIENYARPTIAHYEQYGFSCLVVMLPARRQSRTKTLQIALAQAMTTFIETGQSQAWHFKK